MAYANTILDQAIRRLNELSTSAPVHWTRAELLVFLNDGISELNLISADYQTTVDVTINSSQAVWDITSGIIAPLSVRVDDKYLIRESVEDLDKEYDWEDPIYTRMDPKTWAPVGLYKMVVFPRAFDTKTASVECLTQHTAVTDAAVALPVRPEYERPLEDYIVSRALFKEGGAEFQQGTEIYNRYVDAVNQLAGRNVLRAAPLWETKEAKTSETTLRGGVEE